MNLLFRMLRVFVAALFRSRIGLLDSSELKFRVLPTDLDINVHMTNARYLSVMDLGRTDLLIRAGMLKTMRRRRWMPVVGHIDIRFRRSLSPFQRFSLTSRLGGKSSVGSSATGDLSLPRPFWSPRAEPGFDSLFCQKCC